VLIYGPPGVGKSTFAAGAPAPLIFDVEGRTEHLDVDRLPPEAFADTDEDSGWDRLIDAMRDLVRAARKEDLKYKTIVFDTIDRMEQLVFDHLCAEHDVDQVDEVLGGYGKWVQATIDQLKRFLAGVEAMRRAGLQPIILGHSQIKKMTPPDQLDYDVYTLKMNMKVAKFVIEQMDVVGFARFDDVVRKAKKGETKAKVVSTNKRVLHLQREAAFEAKGGIEMPAKIELDWSQFEDAINQARR